MENNLKLHYPPDIKLESNPLIEAWLEIRWELESSKDGNLPVDPAYQYTLGALYSSVKDKYPIKESLPANQIPEGLAPSAVTSE